MFGCACEQQMHCLANRCAVVLLFVCACVITTFSGPLPLPLTDRSSTSRASSSHRTYASMQSRRASSAAAAAATYRVSTSRAGAARAAAILLLSCRQQVVPCEPVTRVVYTIGAIL